jgi:hypothetical protein
LKKLLKLARAKFGRRHPGWYVQNYNGKTDVVWTSGAVVQPYLFRRATNFLAPDNSTLEMHWYTKLLLPQRESFVKFPPPRVADSWADVDSAIYKQSSDVKFI